MPTLYLIFGHLLADFVLQPFQLVLWKFRSRQGIFFHSLVHLLIYLAVFLPYLPDITVILTLLAVAGAHFVIDSLKIDKEKTGRRYPVYFLLDQLIHLLTLVAGGLLILGVSPNAFFGRQLLAVYGNFYLIFGLIGLFFVTYAIEMFCYQFKRTATRNASFKPDYGAMLNRAIIFLVPYGVFLVFGAYRVAAWV